jgi:hypothetical protein
MDLLRRVHFLLHAVMLDVDCRQRHGGLSLLLLSFPEFQPPMNSTLRSWVLVGLALLPPVFASAQLVVREKQVPEEIRDDFALRFDAAESVQWLKQGNAYYGARFQLKGEAVEAVYAQDGQWEQTDEAIAYAALPDKARTFLARTYPGLLAHSNHKVATRRHGIVYEVMVSGTGTHRFLTFDMHGELLSNAEMEVLPAAPDSAAKAAPRLPALFKKGDGR